MGNSVYPSDTPPTTRLHPLSFPNSSRCQGPSTQIYEPMGARLVKPALVLLFFLESFVLYGQVFCLDVDLYTYHVSAVPVEVRRECWGPLDLELQTVCLFWSSARATSTLTAEPPLQPAHCFFPLHYFYGSVDKKPL